MDNDFYRDLTKIKQKSAASLSNCSFCIQVSNENLQLKNEAFQLINSEE